MTTSNATARRILDTAVTLFADKGFEQTSVRDITTAAGVNLAAINYHFGSRDALVQAVAERYLTPLCQDMDRQFDDHEAGRAELSLEDLLELLISAMLKAVERDTQGVSLFMRLMSQAYMSADDALREFLERRYGRSFRRFFVYIRRQLPRLSRSEFYWRCHFLVGSSVLPLARYGLLSEQEQLLLGQHARQEEVFHRLVAFLAAALRADADLVSPRQSGSQLSGPQQSGSQRSLDSRQTAVPSTNNQPTAINCTPHLDRSSALNAELPITQSSELPITQNSEAIVSVDRYRIHVDLTRQCLTLFAGEQRCRRFSISSAKNGAGQLQGSGCTPLGRHRIRAKIGSHCRQSAVFVGRRPTGEHYTAELARQYPKRDWILSRILWLSGCEPGVNRLGDCDSMQRYIYIHGTPDSEPMGRPFSHGCIRMRNDDIIWLFEHVDIGTVVQIDP